MPFMIFKEGLILMMTEILCRKEMELFCQECEARKEMEIYKCSYIKLFNRLTKMTELIVQTQQESEELYISGYEKVNDSNADDQESIEKDK